jgi:hypothetical protein
LRRRATTILDPAARATRHERRSSTGAAFFAASGASGGAGGTVGRVRRSSMMGSETATMSKAERLRLPSDVREQPEELSDEGARDGHADGEKENEHDGRYEKEQKPVFLKGLLRCVGLSFLFLSYLVEADGLHIASPRRRRSRRR